MFGLHVGPNNWHCIVGNGCTAVGGADGHWEGCVQSDKVRCGWFDEANEVVERLDAILIVGDAEEQGCQDFTHGSEVIILGIVKDGRKFCGGVGKKGREFFGEHCGITFGCQAWGRLVNQVMFWLAAMG